MPAFRLLNIPTGSGCVESAIRRRDQSAPEISGNILEERDGRGHAVFKEHIALRSMGHYAQTLATTESRTILRVPLKWIAPMEKYLSSSEVIDWKNSEIINKAKELSHGLNTFEDITKACLRIRSR